MGLYPSTNQTVIWTTINLKFTLRSGFTADNLTITLTPVGPWHNFTSQGYLGTGYIKHESDTV